MIEKMKWLEPKQLQPEILEKILQHVPEMVKDLSNTSLNGDMVQYPYFIDCFYSVAFSVPDLNLVWISWHEDEHIYYHNLQETK